MKPTYHLLPLFCIIAVTAFGQKHLPTSLNIGDPAPPLQVQGWIKGTPVQSFEKGKVYVVDFWATWCRPCLASMPHLSALAHEYRDKVIFIAVAVWENGWEDGPPATSMEQIKAFVDSMGRQMDFSVAVDNRNFMLHHWVEASNENSIPRSFVVNAQGRLAWIGNPVEIGCSVYMDRALLKIVNNTWNIKEALSKRIFNKHLEERDSKISDSLSNKWRNLSNLRRADSVLWAINRIIKKEPNLKYVPNIAYITFGELLMTNQHKAYEYGKKAIITTTYQCPAIFSIISDIEDTSLHVKILPQIYYLGAEAYQSEIDNTNPSFQKLLNIPGIYQKMAACYLLAHDTLKAREATQKAIEWVKPIKSPQ